MQERDGEHTAVTTTDPGAVTRERRAVRVLAIGSLAVALAAGVVLALRGASWPTVGPVLLLAVATAVAVNRFVLIPTEHAATAEPAVLLAAIVGFRGGAAVLGPLIVALLVGPLDALHWQQRSFLRMAYNSGNRALAVLAASGAYAVVHAKTGSVVAGVGIAVVAVAATDGVLSYVLLRLRGESARDARRHVLDFDALAVPFGAYGATAGALAPAVGWWATTLILIPVAFVPELLFSRGPWRARLVRQVASALVVTAVLVVLAMVASVPSPPVVMLLLGVAILAGVELVADDRARVPPVLAVVVVAAVVFAPTHAYFAAAFVALVATAIAGIGARAPMLARAVGLAATVVGALAAAAVVELTAADQAATIATAVLAGVVFGVVAVVVGGERRRLGVRAVWAAPLVAVVAAWCVAGRGAGPGGRIGGVVAAVVTFALVTCWGTPPWRSRVLARWHPTVARHVGGVLVLTLTGAVGCAIVAAGVADPDVRHAAVSVAVGLGESALAMVVVGVRQWRFVPRVRAQWLSLLLGASAVLCIGYPAAAWSGAAWPVAIVVVVALGAACAARGPVARLHELPPRAESPSAR